MKKIIEEITNEVEKIEFLQSQLAKSILNELKYDTKTYREVEEKIKILKRTFFYSIDGNEKYGLIINEVQRLLEEEKSDLQVTNCL